MKRMLFAVAIISSGGATNAPTLQCTRKTVDIIAGRILTCARREDDGRLVCFGGNKWANLGIESPWNQGDDPGEMGNDIIPVLALVDNVTCGFYHCCGIEKAAEKVVCWGSNWDGQLGIGEMRNFKRGDTTGDMASLSPVPIPST
eukprot:Hpha_TRINITY_DN23616_c0_g1::TRINITY_DN23616_c0_g1_i1::g.57546::m.57546